VEEPSDLQVESELDSIVRKIEMGFVAPGQMKATVQRMVKVATSHQAERIKVLEEQLTAITPLKNYDIRLVIRLSLEVKELTAERDALAEQVRTLTTESDRWMKEQISAREDQFRDKEEFETTIAQLRKELEEAKTERNATDRLVHEYAKSAMDALPESERGAHPIMSLVRALATAQAQVGELRAIFPRILESLGNGSFCAVDCSVVFLSGIPEEVAAVTRKLKAQVAALRAARDALPADWTKDSSLETWFPMTAELLPKLQSDKERLDWLRENWPQYVAIANKAIDARTAPAEEAQP
jgi:chromosome segregation ATPase